MVRCPDRVAQFVIRQECDSVFMNISSTEHRSTTMALRETTTDQEPPAREADAPWQDAYGYLDRVLAHEERPERSGADAPWQPTYDYLGELLSEPLQNERGSQQ
jgi:hypothetical protein